MGTETEPSSLHFEGEWIGQRGVRLAEVHRRPIREILPNPFYFNILPGLRSPNPRREWQDEKIQKKEATREI
ncbi:hypothetical protein SCOR_34110 [Sulfidibacter corallicola]